jgi:uncharacterized protein (TIGR03437 family)
VSAIAPYLLAGKSTTRVEVEYQGVRSLTLTTSVTPVAPALFTLDATGRGYAIAVNEDGSINDARHAAPRNSYIVMYATGAGALTPPLGEDAVAGAVLSRPTAPVSITIGGKAAEVLYAGTSPGLSAGVLQLNVRVPANAEVGTSLPVMLTIGRATSQAGVYLAIR